MIVVLGIFVAAMVLLAPQRDEWLAVLQDDGKGTQVVDVLEPLLTRNPDDLRLLATLARAYGTRGEYGKAIELTLRYVALNPTDADAYAQLGDLYKQTGDRVKQMAMLRQSVEISPQPARALELSQLYRTARRADDERDLLSRFESMLTVDNGLLLRLSRLRSDNNDRQGAIGLLMRPSIISPPLGKASQAEARLLLAELLVESGQRAKAVQLGRIWVADWKDASLATRLLHIVSLQAAAGDLDDLADAVAALYPNIMLYLVKDLAGAGATSVALHLLGTWIVANPSPTPNEIAAFLSVCRELDQQNIAWQTFGTVLSRGKPKSVVMQFTKAMAANFGVGALAPFWAGLPSDFAERDPLLAALLSFHEGDLVATRHLIVTVDVSSLSKADTQLWVELLAAVMTPDDALPMLRERRDSPHVSAALLIQYARVVRSLGQTYAFLPDFMDASGAP